MDRSILPMPEKPYAGPVYEDAKDPLAVFEPIVPVRPPEAAPNVLVILLDDVGFGAASVFGGPCRTPTAERLAGNGLSGIGRIERSTEHSLVANENRARPPGRFPRAK